MYFTNEDAKKIPCPLKAGEKSDKCTGSACPVHRISAKAAPERPGVEAAIEAEKAKGQMYCGLGGKPEV